MGDLADVQSALETWATICIYVLDSYRTGAYTCTDGCLYVHGWVLINSHGRVLIYAWTGAYTCIDGYLYVCMHGWVFYMHGRALGHIVTSKYRMAQGENIDKFDKFSAICQYFSYQNFPFSYSYLAN